MAPTGSEAALSAPGLLGFLIHVLVVAALVVWGRRVARERGGRGWRIASYLPIVGIGASMLGVLGTVVGLVRAFGSVAGADASHRAELLSDGIATAMWSTALGLGTAVVLYVGCFFAFLYGSYAKR